MTEHPAAVRKARRHLASWGGEVWLQTCHGRRDGGTGSMLAAFDGRRDGKQVAGVLQPARREVGWRRSTVGETGSRLAAFDGRRDGK